MICVGGIIRLTECQADRVARDPSVVRSRQVHNFQLLRAQIPYEARLASHLIKKIVVHLENSLLKHLSVSGKPARHDTMKRQP